MTILSEDTRMQQVANSRNAGPYKNKKYGKNRFERKKYSKIATQVKSYNQIDMNQFFKQDILEVNIPVTGETGSYDVTIKLEGIVAEIEKNIKSNQNKLEYRTIVQAITKVFNTGNVYTKCTCDDFKFRFAHWNIVHNTSVDGTDKDPGQGKGLANPNDDKGRGCKHILLVLANQDWIMKVASCINNYINWMAENKTQLFNKIIFPKLYGININDAKEANLVPEDTKLDSEKHIIDVINEYGRNRGKIRKGSNKNPVAQKQKEENKEEEK